MEYKHNIEMMNNDITQSELALKNKDSVIEQLRSQINEMNSEIDEKMKDLQILKKIIKGRLMTITIRLKN